MAKYIRVYPPVARAALVPPRGQDGGARRFPPDDLGEDGAAAGDLLQPEAAVAEEEAVAGWRAGEEGGQGSDQDAACIRGPGDALGIERGREVEAEVEPGVEPDRRGEIGDGSEGGEEGGPVGGVVAAHAADVAGQVPFVQKRGQRPLHRPGGVEVGQRF